MNLSSFAGAAEHSSAEVEVRHDQGVRSCLVDEGPHVLRPSSALRAVGGDAQTQRCFRRHDSAEEQCVACQFGGLRSIQSAEAVTRDGMACQGNCSRRRQATQFVDCDTR